MGVLLVGLLGSCLSGPQKATPAPSPGDLIAFASDRDRDDFNLDLYVMNEDSGRVRRLTQGKDMSSFEWSPDGSRILLAGGIKGDVFVMRNDGRETINLTKTQEDADYEPRWSPDGSRILFFRETLTNRRGNVPNVTRDVHVMNADGKEVRAIDLGAVTGATIQPSLVWAPDSSGFAMVSRVFLRATGGPTMSNDEIFFASIDGSTVRNLTNNSADDDSPAWFPEGSRIAFSTERDGNSEIYTMRADGSEPQRLTQTPERDDSPIWSPDGTKIAFVSRGAIEDRLGNAFVMNADGSALVSVADYVTCCGLGWSADGRHILLTREDAGNTDAYVARADGRGLRNLTNYPGNDFMPAWQPVLARQAGGA